MTPLVVVVGLDYADARRYVLAHVDTRPVLQGARVISCNAAAPAGLRIDRVIETPAARLGRNYPAVMAALRRCVTNAPPLT